MAKCRDHMKHKYDLEVEHLLDSFLQFMIGFRIITNLHSNLFSKSQEWNPLILLASCKKIIENAVEEVRTICIEKRGISPNFIIEGSENTKLICVPTDVEFIIIELLKNAVQASINFWMLPEANEIKARQEKYPFSIPFFKFNSDQDFPPVTIKFGEDDTHAVIKISDVGGGLPKRKIREIFKYFSTSENYEPTYTYSGDFGVPMQGIGVGIPFALQYTKFMGGFLEFNSLPSYGSDIFIGLEKKGLTHF